MNHTTAFVFDRLNENSLLAAAVAKHYLGVQIYDVEQVARHHFPHENMEFHWVGIQPTDYLAKTIKGKHYCYSPDYTKKLLVNNVYMVNNVRNGNEYMSVVEQVIYETIIPTFDAVDDEIIRLQTAIGNFGGDDTEMQNLVEFNSAKIKELSEQREANVANIQQWIGVGFFMRQFYERETAMYIVHCGFRLIKMVFEFVYYNRPWDNSVVVQVNDDHTLVREGTDEFPSEAESKMKAEYLDAVEKTKHLLSLCAQAEFRSINSKVIATQEINISDHHLYVAKRLIGMAGQIWRTPRMFGKESVWTSNEKESRQKESLAA